MLSNANATTNTQTFGNIRNLDHFLSQLANWDFLNGAFSSPKIKVGDYDGVVEIQSNLLVLEKKSNGVQLSTGQSLMYERMQKAGYGTTFVIWYDKDNKIEQLKIYWADGRTRVYPEPNEELVRKLVREWEDWARANPFTRN